MRLPVLVALVAAAEGSGDSRDIEAVNRLASKLMGDAENLARSVVRRRHASHETGHNAGDQAGYHAAGQPIYGRWPGFYGRVSRTAKSVE